MKTQLMILNESPALRQRVCGQEAKNLLDICGNLEYLTEREVVTKAAVCQYYGVPVGSLKSILNRHRKEFEKFGYNILSKKDFERLQNATLKSKARRIAIFPPSSILLVGLLLRDSEVAQRIRSVIWQHLLSKRQEFFDEEVLLESRSFRDSYSTEENLSILDLVCLLSTLPDTAWSTVKQVAEYYRVGIEAIESIILRHRSELESDGFKILRKKELANLQLEGFIDATTSRLAIFTRRAVLRVGMLLRDSEVAREVRSYLLHAESLAPWRQKKGEVGPAPVLYATKEDLEALEKRLEERRKKDMKKLDELRKKLETRMDVNMKIIFDTLKEREERWATELGFLHGLLKNQDSRQQKAMAELEKMWKEDIDSFFTTLFRQEERWSSEFCWRIVRGNTTFENQLEEFRCKQDLILEELEAIKKKL